MGFNSGFKGLMRRKQISNTLLFMSAATLKPIQLECYLPRLPCANKVSSFRADSLDRYLLQCAWDFPCVATSMDTHVGLNVATRSCIAYPDKCLFAVLCRFWLQCSRTLSYLKHSELSSQEAIRDPWFEPDESSPHPSILLVLDIFQCPPTYL